MRPCDVFLVSFFLVLLDVLFLDVSLRCCSWNVGGGNGLKCANRRTYVAIPNYRIYT